MTGSSLLTNCCCTNNIIIHSIFTHFHSLGPGKLVPRSRSNEAGQDDIYLLLLLYHNLLPLLFIFLLAFMIRTPLLRLQQTTHHLIKNTSPALTTLSSSSFSTTTIPQQNLHAMSDRPNGLIAKSGLELLTFGTPNGELPLQSTETQYHEKSFIIP